MANEEENVLAERRALLVITARNPFACLCKCGWPQELGHE